MLKKNLGLGIQIKVLMGALTRQIDVHEDIEVIKFIKDKLNKIEIIKMRIESITYSLGECG